MASSFVYEYDHGHRPRLSDQEYKALKDVWDVVGAPVGGTPGLLLVGRSQFKRRQEDEREAASAQRAAGDEDAMVWPPPPHT